MKRKFEASPGVLAKEQIQDLAKTGCISNSSSLDYDTSAFDLQVGSNAWELDHGLRPTTREVDKIKRKGKPLTLDGGAFLLKKQGIYLLELDHHFELPPNISGRATGRSSIGRLDVITRLLVPGSQEFDVVPANHSGNLYVLVLPQTFSIRLTPGGSLNQLRLFCGSQSSAVLSRDVLAHYGTPFWYEKDGPSYKPWPEERPASGEREELDKLTQDPLLANLRVNLQDPEEKYVFEARSDVDDVIDLGKKGAHDPKKFFQKKPVETQEGESSVTLKRENFYIMKSQERLHIPKDVAVEVVAISERIGDIRIHYAGFAHPGFGTQRTDAKKGTPLIFEVRSTDMTTKLSHETLLARVQLFRMSQEPFVPPPKKDSYDHQELRLSAYFSDWNDD